MQSNTNKTSMQIASFMPFRFILIYIILGTCCGRFLISMIMSSTWVHQVGIYISHHQKIRRPLHQNLRCRCRQPHRNFRHRRHRLLRPSSSRHPLPPVNPLNVLNTIITSDRPLWWRFRSIHTFKRLCLRLVLHWVSGDAQENTKNKSKPILCVCVCITINTKLKLMLMQMQTSLCEQVFTLRDLSCTAVLQNDVSLKMPWPPGGTIKLHSFLIDS